MFPVNIPIPFSRRGRSGLRNGLHLVCPCIRRQMVKLYPTCQGTEAQMSTDDDTQRDIDHTINYLKTVPRDELIREDGGDDSNQR